MSRPAQPASSPASSDRFYLPELDSLRFFAFFGVFLQHALPHDAGYYQSLGVPAALIPLVLGILGTGMFGVDLFFLLSSFLITSLLVREQAATGRVDVRGFWIRRCLRIWPLYFAFVGLAGFLLPPFFHFVPPPEDHHLLGLFTFTHNWAIAFSDAGRGSATLVLWSVSLEEQFYFTWPVLIALAGVGRLRTIAWGLVAFAFVARVFAIQAGASWFMLWCATPFRLEPIAVGALLALGRARLPALTPRARVGCLALGAALAVGCAIPWTPSDWRLVAVFPLITVASALLLLACCGCTWKPLTSGPLVYLGKISYGLYVFHQLALQFSPRLDPGIPFGRTIAAFLLTVALAALSYRFLERPFLRLKDRFAHVHSRPV